MRKVPFDKLSINVNYINKGVSLFLLVFKNMSKQQENC